jgi:hypothetical protein
MCAWIQTAQSPHAISPYSFMSCTGIDMPNMDQSIPFHKKACNFANRILLTCWFFNFLAGKQFKQALTFTFRMCIHFHSKTVALCRSFRQCLLCGVAIFCIVVMCGEMGTIAQDVNCYNTWWNGTMCLLIYAHMSFNW